MIEQIAIDGPLRTGDGYSQITRGLIKAFTRLGVVVHSSDNWGPPESPVAPEVEQAVARGFGRCKYGIRLSQPDSFASCPSEVKIGFSMWEFDAVPKAAWRGQPGAEYAVMPWGRGMNQADINLVPCSWSAKLWRDAGCTKPVHVVPLGHDPLEYHWADRHNRVPVFVLSGTLSGRKNPQMLVQAFCELWPDPSPEGPGLVLKSCAHLPVGAPEREDILVINETWPPERINELYARCDVMVHPTQGEGFGLTMLEGMATGLPVVAPWWSGPADYLDAGNSWELRTEWASVSSDFCLDPEAGEYQQFRYRQPLMGSLKERLRLLAREPGLIPSASHAAVRTARALTWEATARRILEVVEEEGA